MLIRARERAFPSLPIFSTTSLHNSSLRYKHTFFLFRQQFRLLIPAGFTLFSH